MPPRHLPFAVGAAAVLPLLAHLPPLNLPFPGFLPEGLAAVLILLAGWLHLREEESSASAPVAPVPKEWSMDVIRRMDWKRFENLCAVYYPTTGIQGRALQLGDTGGMDVRLYQDEEDPDYPTAIVRCKSSSAKRMDGAAVRELDHAMYRQDIPKGFYMCRAGFDEDAAAEAAKRDITLVDGPVLLHMLLRLPKEDQERLLDFATEGDWTTPTCPVCNIKMEVRVKETKKYWRCPNARTRCDQRMKLVD